MSELVEFIRGCLDADEQTARAAAPGPWEAGREPGLGWVIEADGCWPAITQNEEGSEDDAAHIARHDPARVLAEVNAKRAILDLHSQEGGVEAWMDAAYIADMDDDERAGFCPRCAPDYRVESFPCATIRALAECFRGEPGWRDKWGTQ